MAAWGQAASRHRGGQAGGAAGHGGRWDLVCGLGPGQWRTVIGHRAAPSRSVACGQAAGSCQAAVSGGYREEVTSDVCKCSLIFLGYVI
jgi:hypothetical protein